MKSNVIEVYDEYVKKTFNRQDVFLEIYEKFSIKKAIYPGSYIHITPSLTIPEVIYIDTVKKAKEFFKHREEILGFIENNKIYSENSIVKFEPKDYWSDLSIPKGYCDLLISQYAGFVSQACKKYLRRGGILLANDSHGDATMAHLDSDFEFIGVLEYSNGKYNFSKENLDEYFTFKRPRPIDIDKVKKLMKGPKYKITAEHYIFKKITD